MEAKEMILKHFPELSSDDITITSSGAGGEDLKFSPKARDLLPFSFECKNVQKTAIWSWLEQAFSNSMGHIPAVLFKKNRKDLQICMSFLDFLEFISMPVSERQTAEIVAANQEAATADKH